MYLYYKQSERKREEDKKPGKDGFQWNASQRGIINRIQHGSMTQQDPNRRYANVITAGAVGCMFLLRLPAVPRAGTPRTRKYTNAAWVGSMNSSRYCGAEDNLEPTGVQKAFNHVCKIVLRTADLAWMKPVNGRFGKAEPDLPHATQWSNASRETRKWM